MFNLNESAGHQGPTAKATRRLSFDSKGQIVEGTDPERERLYCAEGDLIPVAVAEKFRMLPEQQAEDAEGEENAEGEDDTDPTTGQQTTRTRNKKAAAAAAAEATQ